MMNKFLLIYLLSINVIGLLVMFLDKQKAKRQKWRIPEKTLFSVALLGGALGTTLGMHFFRHKTKHWYFRYGMPLILLVQVGLFGYAKGSGLF